MGTAKLNNSPPNFRHLKSVKRNPKMEMEMETELLAITIIRVLKRNKCFNVRKS